MNPFEKRRMVTDDVRPCLRVQKSGAHGYRSYRVISPDGASDPPSRCADPPCVVAPT
jgi:hypothetical protein